LLLILDRHVPSLSCSRLLGAVRSYVFVAACALAACTSSPPLLPPAAPPEPIASTIAVVERGWHTDVCIRAEDAGPWLLALAHGSGFDGERFLCFGFGERQYVLTHDHGPLATLSALLPSRAALLMTVLRDSPGAAFGTGNVVNVGISRAGLIGLQAFLQAAVQTDEADPPQANAADKPEGKPIGKPIGLGEGPYPGSVFFAATGTYDLFYTCNTWTATALRSAGLPVHTTVLFAGGVMRQARQLAAPQLGSAP